MQGYAPLLSIALSVLLIGCTHETQPAADLLQTVDAEITQIKQILQRSFIHGYGSRAISNENDIRFLPRKPGAAHTKTWLRDFFTEQPLSIQQLHPYSFLAVNDWQDDLGEQLGVNADYFAHFPDMAPSMKPHELQFRDGSQDRAADYAVPLADVRAHYRELVHATSSLDDDQLRVGEKVLIDESFADSVIMKSTKPPATLTYTVDLPLPQQRVINVHDDEKIIVDDGTIHIEAITDNVVVYTLPEALAARTSVLAQYDDGRYLAHKQRTTNSWLSQAQTDAYEARIEQLRQSRLLIQQGKIVNEQALHDHIDALVPDSAVDDQPRQRWVYESFHGPVDKAYLIISADSASHHQTLRFTPDTENTDGDWGYQLVNDFETGKKGILADDGHWKIAPRFSEDFRAVGAYFFTKNDRLYHFDPDIEALDDVPYRLVDHAEDLDPYAIVETVDLGNAEMLSPQRGYGIVHARSGKTIVPIRYDLVGMDQVSHHFFGIRSDTTDVYDPDGTRVFVLNGRIIAAYDGFFYVQAPSTQVDIYNQHGENMTHGRFNRMAIPFSDGRLYATMPANDGTDHEYFIDENGQIIIDLHARHWSDPENYFSQGLLGVKDTRTGLYGFVDTHGEIALPLVYHQRVHGFMPESDLAVVQKKADSQLYDFIDKQGQSQATIKGTLSDMQCDNYEENCRFLFEDGRVYDAFGKLESRDDVDDDG